MSEATPLYEEDNNDNGVFDRDIYYVDAEPVPGPSPRLGLPLPVGVEHYSSRHAPFGVVSDRIGRGDLTVFAELAATKLRKGQDGGGIGGLVGSAMIDAIDANPALARPMLSALEKVPAQVRSRIVSRINYALSYAAPEKLEPYAAAKLFKNYPPKS